MKKYLVLLFVFFGTIVAGQDLAPDSVDNTIYLAIAANRNTPFLFGLSASILSPNGTRTSINASGLPGYSFTEPYRWIKTAPNAGTLVFAADGNVPRFEVVFTSAGKGTVRQVTFSDTGAAVTGSITFAPFPHDLTPALLNLSTRRSLVVGQPSIAGFVVGGPNPRRVLIRAIGPSLAQFGVTGVVANPSLAVFKGNTQIGANAGWGGDASLAAVFASVGAFALPATSADCAMVLTLDPGDYTAQVTANSNGEALIEVYFVN